MNMGRTCLPHAHHHCHHQHSKGGKGSLWEGGYRTPGFVAGGAIPAHMRGQSLDGLVHISDWYPTFIAYLTSMAAHDPNGPTPVTGLNLLPYLTGRATASPRTEIVHDHLMHCVPDGVQSLAQCERGQTPDFPSGHYPNHTTGALTQQDTQGANKLWKLLVGPAQQASWYGRFSPNSTSKVTVVRHDVDAPANTRPMLIDRGPALSLTLKCLPPGTPLLQICGLCAAKPLSVRTQLRPG